MKKSDVFITDSLFIFIAMLFANIFNYVFQILMASFLSINDYGILNTCLSIIFPYIITQTPIQNWVLKEILNCANEYDEEKLLCFLNSKFFLYILILSLLPFSVVFFISFILKISFLHFFLISMSCMVSIPFFVSMGIFQSKHDTKRICLATLLYSFLKCILSGYAACCTKSLNWVLVMIVTGFFITSLFCILIVQKKIIRVEHNGETIAYIPNYRTITLYISTTSIVYLCYSFMQLQDILLVKHYCSLYDTGIYSSAAVLGKAVIYLPSAITMILFPSVTEKSIQGKSALSFLIKSVVLNFVLSGGGAVVLFFAANRIIPIFFGAKYIEAIPIIRYLGLAFMPFSMIIILFTYFLAKQNFCCIWPMVAAISSQFITAHFMHSSLMQLVISFFVSGMIGCIGFFIISIIHFLKYNQRDS